MASYLNSWQSVWTDLAKPNSQQNPMEQHITERNSQEFFSRIQKQIATSEYFLNSVTVYLFFLSWPILSR